MNRFLDGIRWVVPAVMLPVMGAYPNTEAGNEAPLVPAHPLRTLHRGHPRLMLRTNSVATIRKRIAEDDLAKQIYEARRKDADALLDKPVSRYEIPDGKRLLHVSRRVLDRVQTLALVRLIEDDRRYAERAWREMKAAAEFPDWNPSHFLDTAEMTRALATGFDWLYADWSEAQRRDLAEAILELGLNPALEVYRKRSSWWPSCNHNWNQVCNGGIGLGALAVAELYPDDAEEVLRYVLTSLPRAMRAYAPDGAGAEGPTYWVYGCGYNVAFLDGLVTALGRDFGLSSIAGFEESGFYPLYLTGAGGIAFDFADCGGTRVSAPAHWWLAARYGQPTFAQFRREQLLREPREGDVFDLLWFDDHSATRKKTLLPLDRHFRHAECATMRSAWGDPNAVVLAVQGGDNRFNHWHLDLGSFILEALGERWIIDSGVERQSYHRHRNKCQRWEFYRIRAEGHNTLVLNPAATSRGCDQNQKGKAPILAFESHADSARVVMDLTDAYRGHAMDVKRTFVLTDHRRAIVVEDTVGAGKPADLWWFAHTEATVFVADDGRSATLERHGKRLTVVLEAAPDGAKIGVMDARPLPGSPDPDIQDPNRGRRKLFLHLPHTTSATLRVRFTPESLKK